MRAPNPWVALPAIVGGLIAGFVGWVVTDVSCRRETSPGVVEGCPGLATVVAVGSFFVAVVGIAVVVVLVFRSLGEYREGTSRRTDEPDGGR